MHIKRGPVIVLLLVACGGVALAVLMGPFPTVDVFRAAAEGDLRQLKRFFAWGGNPDVVDDAGYAALFYAAMQDQAEAADLLLKHGATVTMKAQNTTGENPLHLVTSAAMVTLLVKSGADVRAADNEGRTAVHWACRGGYVSAIQALLRHGARVNVSGEEGNRDAPIHEAVYGGMEVLQILLQAGAEIDARGNWGWTPLHHAAAVGNEEAFAFLVQKGADIDAVDEEGRKPLDVAPETNKASLTECIRGMRR